MDHSNSEVTAETIIKCAACLKVIDIPMRLPCNHHYCLHCLRLFTKVKGGIQCQICKSWHTISDEGVNGFYSSWSHSGTNVARTDQIQIF